MICFIRNRPALQIGSQQVFDYDTAWLDTALERAAEAAEALDFPFVADIRSGVVRYLEAHCPLQLMPIGDLYDRMRRMLVKIGCGHIAEHLRPLAPPVTVCLHRTAKQAGAGFELGFFGALRSELTRLREAGVEEIRFTGMQACVMELRGGSVWNSECERLEEEIGLFLENWKAAHTSGACAAV